MNETDENNVSDFFKKNFRPLKVKGADNYRIGRLTYSLLLKKEDKNHLSNLTKKLLSELAGRHSLKQVEFDDGNIYVVDLGAEREIMVEFYSQKETQDGPSYRDAIDDEPPGGSELVDSFGISSAAIELLTGGDKPEDLEFGPDSAVDFISCDIIEKALEDGSVRLFLDDDINVVLTAEEDMPENEVFPLILDRPLPGSEVPLASLDLKHRSAITGTYRDQVESSGHAIEHLITRLED